MQTPQRVTAIELQHLREAMTDDEHNWIYISHVRVYLRNDEPYDPKVDDIENYYPAAQSVTEYTWDEASLPVTIKLPQPTEGRYLMLLFTNTRAAPHMSFTELNVYVE
jgi:hypothetical protein